MQRMICGVLVLALAAATGCGRATSVEYVEGVVTLDGQPVAGAVVEFRPVTEGEGKSAYGRTDAQGVYRLTAVASAEEEFPQGGGTLPGQYYVGVTKATPDPIPDDAQPGFKATSTHEVPQRYNLPQNSGIRATVERGRNRINFDLSSNEAVDQLSD